MFDAVLDPTVWAAPLLWQAGLTLAGLVLGVGLGVLLSLLIPVVSFARVLRTAIGYLPALALVLLAAVLLVDTVWPWVTIGLVAVAVFAGAWAAALEAGELTGEQLRAARALDLPRAEVIRLGRGRVRHGLHRVLPLLWRRALAVTTMAGLIATAATEASAPRYGLGGLIATGLRAGEYPPALAGAVWLLVVALLVELGLWLLRPRTPAPTGDRTRETSRTEGRTDATAK
ncbi:MAG: hypothetical protein GXX86_11370 [Propionibacterium sp.]|nr:hypothetical protein [Propionibacterium sp.]